MQRPEAEHTWRGPESSGKRWEGGQQGRAGSTGPCRGKPLGKGVAQSDGPFEKVPVATGWRANQAGPGRASDMRGAAGLDRW